MDLMVKNCTVGSFLIYQWIEQPHKQAVLQETMELLAQKVIVPYTGICSPILICHSLPAWSIKMKPPIKFSAGCRCALRIEDRIT